MAGIAFTNEPGTPVGLVRLYAGDTDPEGLGRSGGDRTRTDSEIEALLAASGGDARLAAAALLEGKAAEYAAAAVVIAQGSLRQDFRQRGLRMLQTAQRLRSTAAWPLGFNPPKREPPFSAGPGGTMEGW
jgi:hypothetical protein